MISARAALALALAALIGLGALAAWLVNVPPLAILALTGAGIEVSRRVVRRVTGRGPRQDTET